ncbi:MAG: hypothetical protein WC443_13420 [Desulfobaccales bacterium]
MIGRQVAELTGLARDVGGSSLAPQALEAFKACLESALPGGPL